MLEALLLNISLTKWKWKTLDLIHVATILSRLFNWGGPKKPKATKFDCGSLIKFCYKATSCVLVVNGWNYVSFHSLYTHNPLIQYYKMKYKKMCLGTQILKLRERLVQQGWIRGQWFDLYWACTWQTLDFKRALLKVMGHLLH